MTGVGSGTDDRLDSWKAIAAYLGRDAGTVRRWERTRGLPVHRVPGGKGSSVFAYTSEIDAWLQAAPQEVPPAPESIATAEPAPRRRYWRWAAAAAVVLVIAAGWLFVRPQANAADVRIDVTQQAVTAKTVDGAVLWVHRLADGFTHPGSDVSDRSRVLTGGNPAVYFTTSHRQARANNNIESGEFTSLDLSGKVRWSFRFDDTLTFGATPFGPPWGMTAFALEDSSPARRIAVAAHHWVWGASLLAVLDDTGKRLGTFANDGWIEQLQWLSPDRLAFAGFSESRNGGMVGLLDPAALDGRSPEDADSPHLCRSCGGNAPLRMAVMPRSEVNRVTHSRFNRAIIERLGDRVIVRTVEKPADGQGAADAIYEFAGGLELVRASFSQRYWEVHDQLFQERKLDHDRAACPDRHGPPLIHTWSPETGWIAQNLPGKAGS